MASTQHGTWFVVVIGDTIQAWYRLTKQALRHPAVVDGVAGIARFVDGNVVDVVVWASKAPIIESIHPTPEVETPPTMQSAVQSTPQVQVLAPINHPVPTTQDNGPEWQDQSTTTILVAPTPAHREWLAALAAAGVSTPTHPTVATTKYAVVTPMPIADAGEWCIVWTPVVKRTADALAAGVPSSRMECGFRTRLAARQAAATL